MNHLFYLASCWISEALLLAHPDSLRLCGFITVLPPDRVRISHAVLCRAHIFHVLPIVVCAHFSCCSSFCTFSDRTHHYFDRFILWAFPVAGAVLIPPDYKSRSFSSFLFPCWFLDYAWSAFHVLRLPCDYCLILKLLNSTREAYTSSFLNFSFLDTRFQSINKNYKFRATSINKRPLFVIHSYVLSSEPNVPIFSLFCFRVSRFRPILIL